MYLFPETRKLEKHTLKGRCSKDVQHALFSQHVLTVRMNSVLATCATRRGERKGSLFTSGTGPNLCFQLRVQPQHEARQCGTAGWPGWWKLPSLLLSVCSGDQQGQEKVPGMSPSAHVGSQQSHQTFPSLCPGVAHDDHDVINTLLDESCVTDRLTSLVEATQGVRCV